MIITKKAKRTYSYIKGVKKKLIKQMQKGHFDDRIGKKEWKKASEMLKNDIYYNIIMSDFSYFLYTLEELKKGNYHNKD